MDVVEDSVHLRTRVGTLLPSNDLKVTTMRAGAWLGVGSVADQTLRFVRNLVLARLMAPSAFGAMAIALSASSLIATLTEIGVRMAIIQNSHGREERYLHTGWWLGMTRAFALYCVVFAIAPFVSRFYGAPELTGLLRVILLSAVFNGAMSPQSTLAEKDMRFARYAAVSSGGNVCGVLLTIGLSLLRRDVWGLAFGYVSESAFQCALSYLLCPGRPRLTLDYEAARDLLRFSRGLFGLGFLTLVYNRADVFVLARLYSSASVGIYTMAVGLVMAPASFLIGVMTQPLLPALSRVQDNVQTINRVLMEVTSWLVALGLPVAVAVSFCARSILAITYGSRYAMAAGCLAMGPWVVLLTILNAMLTVPLFAKGRPDLHRYAVATTAAIMLLIVYPACKSLGIVGGQVAAIVALGAGYILHLFILRRLIRFSLRGHLSAFIAPVLASGGSAGLILLARSVGMASSAAAWIALCFGCCLVAQLFCILALIRTLMQTGTSSRRHRELSRLTVDRPM